MATNNALADAIAYTNQAYNTNYVDPEGSALIGTKALDYWISALKENPDAVRAYIAKPENLPALLTNGMMERFVHPAFWQNSGVTEATADSIINTAVRQNPFILYSEQTQPLPNEHLKNLTEKLKNDLTPQDYLRAAKNIPPLQFADLLTNNTMPDTLIPHIPALLKASVKYHRNPELKDALRGIIGLLLTKYPALDDRAINLLAVADQLNLTELPTNPLAASALNWQIDIDKSAKLNLARYADTETEARHLSQKIQEKNLLQNCGITQTHDGQGYQLSLTSTQVMDLYEEGVDKIKALGDLIRENKESMKKTPNSASLSDFLHENYPDKAPLILSHMQESLQSQHLQQGKELT